MVHEFKPYVPQRVGFSADDEIWDARVEIGRAVAGFGYLVAGEDVGDAEGGVCEEVLFGGLCV